MTNRLTAFGELFLVTTSVILSVFANGNDGITYHTSPVASKDHVQTMVGLWVFCSGNSCQPYDNLFPTCFVKLMRAARALFIVNFITAVTNVASLLTFVYIESDTSSILVLVFSAFETISLLSANLCQTAALVDSDWFDKWEDLGWSVICPWVAVLPAVGAIILAVLLNMRRSLSEQESSGKNRDLPKETIEKAIV